MGQVAGADHLETPGTVQLVRALVFLEISFFKNSASIKQAEESREFPLRAGRSYRRAPGTFYLYKPGMLAS